MIYLEAVQLGIRPFSDNLNGARSPIFRQPNSRERF